jgi:hypothetical protein
LDQLRPPDNNDALETRKANREALLVGVMSHAWAEYEKIRRPDLAAPGTFPGCSPGSINCFECSARPCDQIDWQRRWSLIMHWYNTGKYSRGADQLLDIVRSGTMDYDPR